MKSGHRYRIIYRTDIQRTDRVTVLDFMSETETDYVLSARPFAGTQVLPKYWVKMITEVSKNAVAILLPRVHR